MRNQIIKDIIIGLCVILVQFLLFRHLTFWGISADLIWLYILWICTHKTRTQAIIFAATAAFVQDALLDLWGLNLFAKVLTIFVLYRFINNNTEQNPLLWQVFLIISSATLVHNIIFILLSSFVKAYGADLLPFTFLFGNTIYTALAGTVIYGLKSN